eukprot:20002-Heterococcus_DN1.PRE.2
MSVEYFAIISTAPYLTHCARAQQSHHKAAVVVKLDVRCGSYLQREASAARSESLRAVQPARDSSDSCEHALDSTRSESPVRSEHPVSSNVCNCLQPCSCVCVYEYRYVHVVGSTAVAVHTFT